MNCKNCTKKGREEYIKGRKRKILLTNYLSRAKFTIDLALNQMKRKQNKTKTKKNQLRQTKKTVSGNETPHKKEKG